MRSVSWQYSKKYRTPVACFRKSNVLGRVCSRICVTRGYHVRGHRLPAVSGETKQLFSSVGTISMERDKGPLPVAATTRSYFGHTNWHESNSRCIAVEPLNKCDRLARELCSCYRTSPYRHARSVYITRRRMPQRTEISKIWGKLLPRYGLYWLLYPRFSSWNSGNRWRRSPL